MRKIKLLHVILSLILGLSAAAIGSYPAIKEIGEERAKKHQDILDLNRELYSAMVNRDFSALQTLLSDDFELYSSTGEVIDKQEWIKLIQKRVLEFDKVDLLSTDFQGNQSSGLRVNGEFFGIERDNVVVEMNIRTIVRNTERQIKCIVIKEV
ncbi:nuclear transport factor 2 family protein [Mannheimia haemolytica]|uniref:nuclear transport factor 2 family protein n=1 Tax=Mannheimia haemolytica TaxID=75985 RepID=UPI002E9CFD51|nr:nuclear transport factor 2 family protein [Mannheimia haemolytica]